MALTPETIREMVKDKPELNVLLEGELQSDDPLITTAISMAISDFNSTPPVTRYTVATFPNEAILLYGVCHYLAQGEAERQLRNQVNYSAQGLAAGLDDKYEQYHRLAQYYWQQFTGKVQQFKQHININAAWGQVSSPYSGLNEWNFS